MAYRGIGFEAARAATSAMGAPQQKNALRNIVGAQLVGMAANELLKPPQKKEEEKDFGDRARDFLRGAVNTVVPVYQMTQLYGGTYDIPGQGAAQAPQGAPQEPRRGPRVTTGRGVAQEQEPVMEQVRVQDLSQQPPASAPQSPGMQTRAPAMMTGYAPFGLLRGSTPDAPAQTTERLKRQEEVVRAARAERPSGIVVTDLARKVAEDEQRKLRGLEEEARQYPGAQQQQPQVSQTQNPLLQDVFRGTTTREMFSTGQAAGRPVEEPPMTRQEMTQERREDRAQRTQRATEAQLAEELAALPTDPTTGERQVTSPQLSQFLESYMGEKQYKPRNTGELLSDQLEGQTAFQQQESRLPAVIDQSSAAIDTTDEQGPGAYSGSIADLFKQNAQAMAESDARLYRTVGERLNNIRQLLSEVEGVEPSPKENIQQSEVKALEQKNNYLADVMNRLSSVQEDTQQQLREMGAPQIKVPTPESVPGYSRSFTAAQPSASVGDELSDMMSQLEAKQAGTQSQLAGMGKQTASVPGPEKVPSFVRQEFKPAPSQPAPVTEAEEQTQPQGRKITVTEIEEPAPVQQSMKPMDVAEKLRRIQTSGRPTARQEAQDFLASIKSQMSNG